VVKGARLRTVWLSAFAGSNAPFWTANAQKRAPESKLPLRRRQGKSFPNLAQKRKGAGIPASRIPFFQRGIRRNLEPKGKCVPLRFRSLTEPDKFFNIFNES